MGWAARRNPLAQDVKEGKVSRVRQVLKLDQPIPRPRPLTLDERVATEKKRLTIRKPKNFEIRSIKDDEGNTTIEDL